MGSFTDGQCYLSVCVLLHELAFRFKPFALSILLWPCVLRRCTVLGFCSAFANSTPARHTNCAQPWATQVETDADNYVDLLRDPSAEALVGAAPFTVPLAIPKEAPFAAWPLGGALGGPSAGARDAAPCTEPFTAGLAAEAKLKAKCSDIHRADHGRASSRSSCRTSDRASRRVIRSWKEARTLSGPAPQQGRSRNRARPNPAQCGRGRGQRRLSAENGNEGMVQGGATAGRPLSKFEFSCASCGRNDQCQSRAYYHITRQKCVQLVNNGKEAVAPNKMVAGRCGKLLQYIATYCVWLKLATSNMTQMKILSK
ncbi:hypothetical protein VOLCADRAFT_99100 [Volvox carteri f. nagariensis]|uniref:Uncharacterized protein n=1 Tax=Volvox carteri f. nagariensis TaxID=3068 RepID=D8UH12_VOLCA|nr:uncharacterized protein VOLCADRAFT_99100 [Volvox carteri f. nagariensis]EFJ40992.1 hypothetical protein VOLCADRAFT_99100 [Volvox carteri f. nagariensis]|eukprot:XP_002957966.1 hypothetical protein VOLCADRAFT_99100 [Volvox carteri f. nagariensis]